MPAGAPLDPGQLYGAAYPTANGPMPAAMPFPAAPGALAPMSGYGAMSATGPVTSNQVSELVVELKALLAKLGGY